MFPFYIPWKYQKTKETHKRKFFTQSSESSVFNIRMDRKRYRSIFLCILLIRTFIILIDINNRKLEILWQKSIRITS